MSQPLRRDRGVARDPRMRYAQAMSPGRSPRPWGARRHARRGGRLLVAGRDADALVREHGGPLYVYDVEHVTEQIRALQRALRRGRPALPRAAGPQGAARSPRSWAAVRLRGRRRRAAASG